MPTQKILKTCIANAKNKKKNALPLQKIKKNSINNLDIWHFIKISGKETKKSTHKFTIYKFTNLQMS
jgi:hypothetical protein